MRRYARTGAVLCLTVILLVCAGLAEEPVRDPSAWPVLNEEGFLNEGEFVYEDAEGGLWRYCSTTLWIEIHRRDQEKPKERWYEAEIRVREGTETFSMLSWSEKKRWTSLNYPYKIARKHRSVFAVNSDFAHLRINQKKKPGILLRSGEVVSRKTTVKQNSGYPNLDTLALLPDGDMRVFWSNELTPEEYVEMGAVDVLAFGPWLIRDGEVNTEAISKLGNEKAQRTAIGMVEPGHYFCLVTEGRTAESKGTNLVFVTEKMQALGCVNAINLDGGQSSAMVFMGTQINLVRNAKGYRASARKTAEILAIGTSFLCAEPNDPF